jgi:hypothetical protein
MVYRNVYMLHQPFDTINLPITQRRSANTNLEHRNVQLIVEDRVVLPHSSVYLFVSAFSHFLTVLDYP